MFTDFLCHRSEVFLHRRALLFRELEKVCHSS